MAGDGPRVTPTAAQAAGPPPALDEVMLAMDVVDTLRHREDLVAQELASGDRDAAMLERLRRTYAAQGIDVPEHVLLDGVAALREDRFAYRPAPPSAARFWATLYVRRGVWLRRLAAVAVVALAAVVLHQATVVRPRAELAADLDRARGAIVELARVPEATSQAERAFATGSTALTDGDVAAARAALAELQALRERLEHSYEVRIVVGDDVTSGVWRVPDVNTRARNYYLVVEAVDARGRVLTLPIRNEETGRVERVSSWGLRVDEATFERVRADKADDGIIQERLVGRKARGELDPTYTVATTGGAITRW